MDGSKIANSPSHQKARYTISGFRGGSVAALSLLLPHIYLISAVLSIVAIHHPNVRDRSWIDQRRHQIITRKIDHQLWRR